MAGASVQCVVWEWERDDGGFSPYPPDMSSQIEEAYSTGTGSYTMVDYTVHFSRMIQKKHNTGYERTVRRTLVQLPATPDIKAYWTWKEHGRNYVLYLTEASVDLELAYQKGDTSVNLAMCSSQLPYTIDLTTMEQTRHGYGTRRSIRRQPLPRGSLQSYLQIHSSTVPTGNVLAAPLSLSSPGIGQKSAGSTSLSSSGMVKSLSSGSTAKSLSSGSTAMSLSSGSTAKSLSSGSTVKSLSSGSTAKSLSSGSTAMSLSSGSTAKSLSSGSTVKSLSSSSTAKSLSSGSTPKSRSSGSTPKSRSSGSTAKSSSTSTYGTRKREAKRRRTNKSVGVTSSSSAQVNVSVAPRRDDSEIAPFARKINTLKPKDDGPCPICMNQLSELSGFDEEDSVMPEAGASPVDVYKLLNCEHMMHRACLLMYMKNSSKSGFQCPTCKKVYGIKTGDMPDGTMTVKTQNYSLPGHEGFGTYEITYNFKAGMHNGHRYAVNGFPRICYLPNSPKGQKVLRLLKVAWERRLTFTIGTSVTTGATNTLVWNEIHHKTESTSNYSGHGYPDPNYLDNVLMELAAQGVEDNPGPIVINISSDSDSDL